LAGFTVLRKRRKICSKLYIQPHRENLFLSYLQCRERGGKYASSNATTQRKIFGLIYSVKRGGKYSTSNVVQPNI
jgi:hypothetical protein